MLRPTALLHLYLSRLRVDATAELFAFAGVAVAVALVFAVTVANSSISGSAERVTRAVIGPADLQLHARTPSGFSEATLERVERLGAVQDAAPILEQTATAAGSRGRRATILIAGADLSLATLDGLAHTLPLGTLSPGGIGLSKTAVALIGGTGVHAGADVSLVIRGRRSKEHVSAVLGREAAGALSEARIAVMPLAALQRAAGLPGQISRILIRSKRGKYSQAVRELQAVANGQLSVAPATQDLALLKQALRPSGQASALFAGLSALLGFLLAFNAMLLTVPERRRAISDLRYQGASNSAVAQILLSQALCLGAGASVAGLLGGVLLSSGLLHQSPGYLTAAFTLGSGTVVSTFPVVLSLAGGILATCLVSIVPLSDLRRRALDPASTRARPRVAPWLPLTAAMTTLVIVATILVARAPADALLACVVLAVATILAVQPLLTAILRLAQTVAEQVPTLTALPLALGSLRAAGLRSLALASTGALALFGSVALGSSRADLLNGIDRYTADYVGAADIWLVNPKDNQATQEVDQRETSRLRTLPGVAGIYRFQGTFLDFGDRRVWVIAWPSTSPLGLLDGQIIHGGTTVAQDVLRGGAITVSAQIAAEHHVGVGGYLTLPTPTGAQRFRVAATTTNFGWSPGAVLMNTTHYSAAWGSATPSAVGLVLSSGASPTRVSTAVRTLLGPNSGLDVLSARQRQAAINGSAREGLSQLADIAWLLTGAAVLAMVAALGAALAQRRASLAELRAEGADDRVLRRVLLIEATIMLSAGCVPGALAGLYGQAMIDAYLKHVTGFPVAGATTGARPLLIFALVIVSVLAIMALPGWWASRVPATLAQQE